MCEACSKSVRIVKAVAHVDGAQIMCAYREFNIARGDHQSTNGLMDRLSDLRPPKRQGTHIVPETSTSAIERGTCTSTWP